VEEVRFRISIFFFERQCSLGAGDGANQRYGPMRLKSTVLPSYYLTYLTTVHFLIDNPYDTSDTNLPVNSPGFERRSFGVMKFWLRSADFCIVTGAATWAQPWTRA
jgi:hypothetical protein